MKVYNNISAFIPVKNAVVTTGTFDGVHLGHQQIIRRLIDAAAKTGGETVLLTFFPHPRMVLFPDYKPLLLSTPEEKAALLEKAGIDHLIVHPFNREFSMLSSEAFISEILVNSLHTKKLVIGYDHHFGKNREGSFDHLKEFGPIYGFDVEEIPAQEVEHTKVSSTRIRQALTNGDVETANSFLGYSYTISGTVVKGRMIGRSIDFPTANLYLHDPYKLIPADGVYAVYVKRGEDRLKGMLNIGMRPTVDGKARTIEVNILDFDADLYGETLTLEFVKRLRDEIKFDGIESLKQQLFKDREQTREILS
ncbi:MAG: bifunctional riboflavin kinase/FAD synthetase [Bacteroidota bacterium]|nr:bifunctional riboflavin kinase/FAD synthetase [Bacteroidota bacterium]